MRWIALKLQSAIAPLIVAFIVPLAALAQVMISGGGGGGVSLSAANIWTAQQTFNARCDFNGQAWFTDITGINLYNGGANKSVSLRAPSGGVSNANLSVPPLAGDAEMLVTAGGANQIVTTGMLFPNTLYLHKSGGDAVNLRCNTGQSGVGVLQPPVIADGATDTIISAAAAAQQITGYKLFGHNTLYLLDSLGYATLLRCDNQSGSYQVSLPALTGNCNMQVGLSGTTGAMVAGSVTVANAGIHTGDIINMTRVSGGGTSAGIKTITISDGVGFTAVGNDNTDVGVWNWQATRP